MSDRIKTKPAGLSYRVGYSPPGEYFPVNSIRHIFSFKLPNILAQRRAMFIFGLSKITLVLAKPTFKRPPS